MTREIVIRESRPVFRGVLRLAGSTCEVNANSASVVQGLKTWLTPEQVTGDASFSLRVVVTPGRRSDSVPHFRGRKHIVVALFGAENVFTFDLWRHSITAVVTPDVATDHAFWDRVLLPIAMGILGPAFGVVPVHSACLVADGDGLLIAGESGAGKSTLSVALAQQGLRFVSDDWTYLCLNRGGLVAHGLSVPAKLLPDAVSYLPFLERFHLGIALNQELAYEVPSSEVGGQTQLSCEPRWFFFLERRSNFRGCEILPIESEEAQRYVDRSVERLPPELDSMMANRSAVVASLPRLSCWRLVYGGPPTVAVRGVQQFLASQRQCVSA